MIRNILLSFLFQLIIGQTIAATFVVTSNADSGPGTLRQALLDAAANGSTDKDYITFNIADQSEAGRTIEIPFDLPPLSPDLVIDGLTQPGPAFGISQAKIKLVNTYTNFGGSADLAFFHGTNSGNLSVSGIWFESKFLYAYMVPVVNVANGGDIDISNCLIELGRIQVTDCKSISVKSSLIGYLPDGSFPNGPDVSSIIISNTLRSVIGGSVADGNAISGYINITNYRHVGSPTYLISNNKIGTDILGTTSSVKIWTQKERIRIDANFFPAGVTYSPNFETGQILNNVIANFYSEGIYVSGTGKVDIKGNYLNTDKTGTVNFELFAPDYYFQYGSNYVPTAIYILVGANAVIGGSNPGDANVIANVANTVLEQLAGEIVITQNSIYCVGNPNYPQINIHDFFGINDLTKIPSVKITSISNIGASGTATPNARVELFYDSKDGDCKNCSPRNFITAVTADNQGKWTYTGATPSSLIASAIYNNQTSYFTRPKVDITNLTVKQPHCGVAGEIKGIQFYNAAKAQWVDQNDNLVSTSLDIKNLSPGKYKLKIGSATCGTESDWITLLDDQPKIDAAQIIAITPACNTTGSINGIKATVGTGEILKYSWKDDNQIEKGTSLNISGLPLGKYTLTVTGAINGCTASYGPVILQSPDLLNIDQTAATINSTPCGQSMGSITGVTATGTGALKYSWKNSKNAEVATTKDLTNQPAGSYTLQVTDETTCGPVYTSAIVIPEINGVSINDASKLITLASCATGKGSITGITATGATSYKWFDNNNTVVASTANLQNVAPGNYYLVAANTTCSATSPVYSIGQQTNATNYGHLTTVSTSAKCGLNSGSIEIKFDDLPAELPKTYRWVNQTSGSDISITAVPKLEGLDNGTYEVFATNNAGCERLLANYIEVYRIPELTVSTASLNIHDDNCQNSIGSITGIDATGKTPLSYTWTNDAGNVVGTSADLVNVPAGNYHLKITDGARCEQGLVYTINSVSSIIPTPSADNVQVCSPGDVYVNINNPSVNYSYRLYNDATNTLPLADNKSGKFKVNITKAGSYFVSAYNGRCESIRTEIKVSFGSITTLNLANAFSPNNDGINDTWKIPGVENYPKASVQIFTRSGERIFESTGYTTPFDGNYTGKPLPTGTYYYIINLNAGCGLLSGSLALIR